MTDHYEESIDALAHEIWAAAQLAPGEGILDGIARIVTLLRKEGYPAITHCDNCGCDWIDNGLNPVGCPYCKQSEQAIEIETLRVEVEKLQEVVRPKREEEESWSRCSRACAVEQDKREKAEASAAKLKEALKLAIKWVEVLPPGDPLYNECKADLAAARAALAQEGRNDLP